MTFEIRVVAPQEIYELRRRVLRNNDPSVDVTDARDGEAEALHLGVVSDGAIVTCGSVYPSTSPLHPEVSTYQLRYLATDFAYQGRGYGAALLAALDRSGVTVLRPASVTGAEIAGNGGRLTLDLSLIHI